PARAGPNRWPARSSSAASGSGLALVAQYELAATAVEVEQLRRLDEVDQLAVAVVARIEGRLVADLLAHRAERGPAVLACGRFDGVAQQGDETRVALQCGGVLLER